MTTNKNIANTSTACTETIPFIQLNEQSHRLPAAAPVK